MRGLNGKQLKMYEADVVVIGGGPAGCIAAAACAWQGLHTILLPGKERGNDSSIESIHPGVESLLKRFGAAHAVADATVGNYSGIQAGAHYNTLGGDEQGPWTGHHVDRRRFDAGLLRFAAAAGTRILARATVRDLVVEAGRVTGVSTTDGSALASRYVIDATGYVRLAGKKLAFSEVFFSPPLIAWTGTCTPAPGLHPGEPLTARFLPSGNGWTWIAPLPDGRCTWTRVSTKRSGHYAPPRELGECIPVGMTTVSNRRWRIFRPLCREGVVLCGDAGAIIDPAAGQGILNALLSGLEAGSAVCRILQQPMMEAFYLAHYDDWFFETFRAKVEALESFYRLHDLNLHASQR